MLIFPIIQLSNTIVIKYLWMNPLHHNILISENEPIKEIDSHSLKEIF